MRDETRRIDWGKFRETKQMKPPRLFFFLLNEWCVALTITQPQMSVCDCLNMTATANLIVTVIENH